MKKKYKRGFLLALVLLIFTIGVTSSYFLDKKEIINRLTVGESDISIVEDFPKPPSKFPPGTQVKKEVRIKNNKSESFVRLMIKVNDSALEKKITLNQNLSDWEKGTDGYYYYKHKLKQGETTPPLLKSVTFKETISPGQLKIICYGESVQARGYQTAEEAFSAIN